MFVFIGVAAERFCVRNSGATAVVEGVGDHGCEYMTAGRVLILGSTGRNFAAGMSGGIAYVLDNDANFEEKCNLAMVQLCQMDAKDMTFVQDLLQEFCQKTGSEVAAKLLGDLDLLKRKMVKVFPYEYQRALKELEQEEMVKEAANGHANGHTNGHTRAG